MINYHRLRHWKLGISLSLVFLLGFNILVLTLQVSQHNTSFPSFLQTAEAATVSIGTSAGGGKFFGNNLLQVIIEDEDANGDNNIPNTTISPVIEVRDDHGVELETTSITVPDTSDGSREFEFFLVREGSTLIPDDPENDSPQIIEIGPGADISTSTELDGGFTIKITYRDTSSTVTYDGTVSTLSTDRTSYSIGSEITMAITDFDANADPTKEDIIKIVLEEDDGFFEIREAESFNEDIIFEETDENTGVFEAEFLIGIEGDPEFSGDLNIDLEEDDTTQQVFISIRDSSIYMDDTNSDGTIDEDDDPLLDLETNVQEITITIEEGVNLLANLADPTFSSELAISINAPDRNTDSDRVNKFSSTISDDFQNPLTDDFDPEDLDNTGVIVYIDADGGDIEAVPMKETAKSSGTFVPDYSDNKFDVTFLSDDTLPTPNNGKLEFTLDTLEKKIKTIYIDDIPNPNDRDISSNTIELQTQSGTIETPDFVGVNSEFIIIVIDSDLNDDVFTKDTYSILLDGDAGESGNQFAILKRGEPIGDLAGLELLISSRHLSFETPITLSLTETGLNTGNFSATIEMNEIIQSADLSSIADGQTMEFVYHDNMEEESSESVKRLKIAKSGASLSASRIQLPIPPEEDSATEQFVGSKVVTLLEITDFNENTNAATKERIDLVFSDDADDDEPSFIIDLDGDNGIEEEVSALEDGGNSYEGSILQEIMPKLPRYLEETGNSTGVFRTTLEFVHGDLSLEDWDDLKLTITYITPQDERENLDLVFRGSEGLLSLSSNDVMLGDDLEITIQDNDLNLDDTKIDAFVSQTETSGSEDDYLLAVETEDEELDGEKRRTFTETGPNTGIFTANYTIGLDIPISDENVDPNGNTEIMRASRILITFHDDISSGVSDDRIIEENIDILKQRSQIIIVNEGSIAPGTKVKVMLVEPDFNTSPRKVDTIEFDEDGPAFVFNTDRSRAGEASPKLKETGNNTGTFTFDLSLKPLTGEEIEERFEKARGGSRPEIHVFPGDMLFFQYEDEFDENGKSSKISKSVKVKTYDPYFLLMPPPGGKTRHETDEMLQITMIDPDANLNSEIKDSVRVRAYSYTDSSGTFFQAMETGPNSGKFNFTIPLVSNPAQGSLTAQNGDRITLQYKDQFPGDYEEIEKSRDYRFTFGIGRSGIDTIKIDPPVLRNSRGSNLGEITYVFSQVILSASLVNNNDKEQPFTVIMQAQDMQNATRFKGLSTGVLQENNRASVGLSWIPDTPGNYTLFTYALNSEQTERLSNITQTKIQVLSYNPRFYSDSQSYGEESVISMTIYDPDANRDPKGNDTLDIVVYSSGNPELKQQYEAREYRPNSGEFSFTIQLSKSSSPIPETLPVKIGDEIFIVYTDKMPGNYAELVAEGKETEREIAYTVTVGPLVINSMSAYEMMITSDPDVPQPQPVYEATNGTEVFVFTTFRNNNNKTQDFDVVIQMVEIRSGYTTFVELQSAELGPFEQANFTTSVVLTEPGYYRAKTFAFIEQDEDASHNFDGNVLPIFLSRARIADIQINPTNGSTG